MADVLPFDIPAEAPREKLTDKEMAQLAVNAYHVLDRAFRLCLSTQFKMLARYDRNSIQVTQAIERFMAQVAQEMENEKPDPPEPTRRIIA